MIYLDNSATTKPKNEVVDAMLPYLIDKWYNPSSLYSKATKVKKDIESARNIIGDFIGANGNEIYFTSGGSESNCWAIKGFVDNCIARGKKPCVITSVIEHKSIIECVDNLNDVNVHYIGVDEYGFINIAQLRNMLFHASCICDEEVLVSIQLANNEIGTIQYIEEISREVHRFGGILHVDGVQILGQVQLNVKESGIDMMSASGHKIGTPKGIGFLYIKDGININPLIHGTQMDGMRGGTENVPYIVGMMEAIKLLNKDCKSKIRNLVHMREYMIYELEEKFNCKVNGHRFRRLPNNINVTFPQNITGESLLYTLDLSNIAISTGSACNSKSIEPSYVLKSIGLTNEEAIKTIRFSLPEDVTKENIDFVINEIDKAIKLIEV